MVGCIWWTTLGRWWWWWCSGRLERPSSGGKRGRGKGNGSPPGKAASPPNKADAVECSWAFLLSSAKLVFRWSSPVPGLQQPQRDPGHPAGDQDSISWILLGRWSLVVHNEGAPDVRDDGVLLMILLLKSGGENCAARWGEKNRDADVGGSTGLKPAPDPGLLKQEETLVKDLFVYK